MGKYDHIPPMIAGTRNLVRTAVRAALSKQSVYNADNFGAATVSGLTRDQLLHAADQLGVDAAGIIAGTVGVSAAQVAADDAAADDADADAQDVAQDTQDVAVSVTGGCANDADADAGAQITEETDTQIVQSVLTAADEVDVSAAVKAAMAPLGSGDMQGFQGGLRDLASRALATRTPECVIRTTVRTIVHTMHDAAPAVAPMGAVPYATRGDMRTAGELFGTQGAMANIGVRMWQSAPGAHVPAVDPAFVFHAETSGVVAACLFRSAGLLLHGPRGVGKTTLVQQIAARTGREFVRISCTDTTEACSLVGMIAPVATGGVAWKDGVLTAAIQRPGTVILIDEPSVARPGAVFVLQPLLDGERALTLDEDGGRVVKMADGVTIILADNTNGTGDQTGQYAGTGQLNAATLDRCLVSIPVGYLDAKTEAAMVAKRTGCRLPLARKLAEFAAASRKSADKADLAEGLSPRRVVALAHLMHMGVPFALAFETAVLGSCTPSDREHYAQMVAPLVNAGELDRLASGASSTPAG